MGSCYWYASSCHLTWNSTTDLKVAVAPGLDLPTSVPLQAYKKPRITTGPRSTSTGRSTLSESELLLHCSAHPKLDYTAREESSGEADDLLRHYVGVYDPATGDIQIVPARKVTVRGTLRSTTIPEIRDESSEDEKAPPSVLSPPVSATLRTTLLIHLNTETCGPYPSRRSLWHQKISKSHPCPYGECDCPSELLPKLLRQIRPRSSRICSHRFHVSDIRGGSHS